MLHKIIRIPRAPFFTATLVPVFLGTAIAWWEGHFHWGYFLLAFIGGLAAHAATNIINDYGDHLSGNDEANPHPTPFSGGSRVIQEGVVSAQTMLYIAITCYLLTAIIGLYLAYVRGWMLIVIGALGIFLSVWYSLPRFGASYIGHGLGELAVGLGFGPIMVLGAYYVQTQHLSWPAFWASIPVGFLIAEVLYINEFPDYEADKVVDKHTLIVHWGREKAVKGYVIILAAVYITILIGVLARWMPGTSLLAILTAPLAYKAIRTLRRFYDRVPEIIPANAVTIQVHLFTGLLLVLAYLVAGWFFPPTTG
ncbi:MAG: 1,4-dihydroxy-2-naphthoate octaprenyltransferase [Chloroflexi bacterium]|nr:MAG: 1,4-dihydroxy-2-naphthoate octaprenyltransferase [Chloroflexota bacterium]HDN79895.1 1,4-dihydroxy-2-naphthoate octaprenyltransferase [Chloroflexota bacterium]